MIIDNNNCYDTMKSCYYFNCKNNSAAFPSMKFFLFPTKSDRCLEWIKASGNEELKKYCFLSL